MASPPPRPLPTPIGPPSSPGRPSSPSPGPRPRPSSPKISPRGKLPTPPQRSTSPQVPPRRPPPPSNPAPVPPVPSSKPPTPSTPNSQRGPAPGPKRAPSPRLDALKNSHQSQSASEIFGGAQPKRSGSFVTAAKPSSPQVSGSGSLHRSSTIEKEFEPKFITASRTSRSTSLQSMGQRRGSENQFSDGDSDSEGEATGGGPKTGVFGEADAIMIFNESPNKGIKLLLEHEVVQETPDSVAMYLRDCKELDKKAIGDYLGERDPFAMKVLQAFIKNMDFSGESFEKSLRKLLAGFRLPGESQKIERIMEIFSEVYTGQQTDQGAFKSSDAVFVLAYSTIMLNTDLHNPQVKRKMTLEQFVSNNRGINQGEDLPEAMLTELYQNILETEIRLDGSGPFPNALKKGQITVETKQLYLGKHKKVRNLRHVVFDSDLTLYMFKSVKDEGGSPISEISLKEGMTIYQEGEERKGEKALTIYLTLTPEDTTDAVVSSAWRFILPSEKAFEDWVGVFESHALCVLTFNPPVVGVPLNDEVITHLNRRVNDTSAQLLFLERNLAETCTQLDRLTKESQATSSQIRDLKRRALTHAPSSNMGGCLSIAIKALEDVARLSSNLEISLQENVYQPLLDVSNTEIAAAKDHVGSFKDIMNHQNEVAEKLKKEIQAQSANKAGDRTKTQKLFAESQKLDEKLEASRSGVREALQDITCGCDSEIISSVHQMIHSYYSFYKDGAERLSKIWEEAQEKNKEYEKEKATKKSGLTTPPLIAQSTPTTPLTSHSTPSLPTKLATAPIMEEGNVEIQMDLSAVKTGTFAKKKKKGNWKKYYFTLKRKYLYYFVRFSHNLEFKGVVMLRNCSVIPFEATNGFHFSICTPTDTHYFLMTSEEERREWIEEIEKCIKNDEGFKKRETLNEENEIAESFKRQNDLLSDKKRLLRTHLSVVDMTRDGPYLDDHDIIKQGLLQKRGDKVKNWTQRWFALKQNRIAYYEVLPSGELKQRGTIHLLNAVVKHSERELRPFSFEIQHEYRTYYIAAKDEVEEQEWMEAIISNTTKLADASSLDFPTTDSPAASPKLSPSPRKQRGGGSFIGAVPSDAGGSGGGFVLEGPVLKTGYLIKKGGVRKNWTNRYFELRAKSLAYYLRPGETPKGTIMLEASSMVKKLNDRKPFSFSISQEAIGSREYWLAASDAQEEEEWVYAVEQAIYDLKMEEEAMLGGKGVMTQSSVL